MTAAAPIGPDPLIEALRAAARGTLADGVDAWCRLVGEPSVAAPCEVQAIGWPGCRSGGRYAHARSVEGLLRLAVEAERAGAVGIFHVANLIDPVVATRSPAGHWYDARKGESTTDAQILARRILYLDCDAARRPSGTSATTPHTGAAVEVAAALYRRIGAIVGDELALALGMSGNGGAVLARLDDLPETPDLKATIRGILCAADLLFSVAGDLPVKVDRTVGDAKRLLPLWGTTKRKGPPDVPDRPHRRTALVLGAGAGAVRRLGAGDLALILSSLRADLDDAGRAEVDRVMGIRPASSTSTSTPAIATGRAPAATPEPAVVTDHERKEATRRAVRRLDGAPTDHTDRLNAAAAAHGWLAHGADEEEVRAAWERYYRRCTLDAAAARDLWQAGLRHYWTRRGVAYLDKLPPGVQGQGGSTACLRAAAAAHAWIARGADTGEIRVAWDRYLDRCEPPWTDEREIAHKWTEGAKVRQPVQITDRPPPLRLVRDDGADDGPPSWMADAPPLDDGDAPPDLDGGDAPPPAPLVADKRPVITLSTEIHRVADAAVAALLDGGAPVFSRARALVHVVADGAGRRGTLRPAGTPVIVGYSAEGLRDLLSRTARFETVTLPRNKKGKPTGDPPVRTPAMAPSWLAPTILSRGEWPLRPLESVADAPFLRPDGTVCARPGYDPTTSVLLRPGGEFPPVPDRPTAPEIRAAVGALLDPLADFPFLSDDDRAGAIGGVLSVLARPAIEGPVPLTAIRAPTPGSGKGLLSAVIATVATGRAPTIMLLTPDEQELRKRIASLVLEGAPLIVLDNCEGAIGSATLAAALTAETFGDRRLGTNETISAPARGVWIATGNNLTFRRDLPRRVIPVDLDPGVERPETRTGWRIPDLSAWAARNRGRLVCAALTLLRGFYVAGLPSHGGAPLGSFEGWDRVVRAALVWAEIGDPVLAQARMLGTGDDDIEALRALLAAWSEAIGDETRPLPIVLQVAATTPALRSALAAYDGRGTEEKPNARSLGKGLARILGRVADGRKLVSPGSDRGGVRLYRVGGAGR